MSEILWVLPVFTLLILTVALVRLGRSGSKLSRQTQRLESALTTLKKVERNDTRQVSTPKALDLEGALADRRKLKRAKTKAKAERQRRLVVRLKNLSK